MNPLLILLLLGGGIGYVFYKKTNAPPVQKVPLGASTTPLGQAAQYASMTGHESSAPMAIQEAQHSLNLLGASPALTEDGVSGPNTLAAIKAFQAKANLTVDGIIGPQTASALRIAVQNTSINA